MDDVSAEFLVHGPAIEQDKLIVPRGEVYAGRVSGNDLVLNHAQISRQHLRIFWQDGGYRAEDLGSTNGVWLNNERLEPYSSKRLKIGDTLRLGPFTLVLRRIIGLPEENESEPQSVTPAPPRMEESVPLVIRQRLQERMQKPPSPVDSLVPRARLKPHRYPDDLPDELSNWLEYLPAMYSDSALDPTHFVGRYLLIFETLMNRVSWVVDNFDLYLSPETAPPEWMQWMASWFDIELLAQLPEDRQRAIMRQPGWLFLRRGTKIGLERMLELTFGVRPEIIEAQDGSCHFTVRLPLSQSDLDIERERIQHLIETQKPAFTTFTLEII